MKKKVLSGLLAIAMLFGSAAALPEDVFETSSTITASALTEEDFEYELSEDGTYAILTKYNNTSGAYCFIPDTLGGKPVEVIAEGAFANNTKLETVYSSYSSVRIISKKAFYGCSSLKSISLPETLEEINNSAFEGCSSLSYPDTLPGSLKKIGNSAFKGCTSLTKITIPGSVKTFGKKAFSGCTSLKGVTIQDGVKELNEGIFENCSSLISITIPDGINNIPVKAFNKCTNLSKVKIPDSVTNIGAYAFTECDNLKRLVVPKSVKTLGTDNTVEPHTNNNPVFDTGCTIICGPWSAAYTYVVLTNNVEYYYEDEENKELRFVYKELDDDTVEITEYIGDGTTVAIPSTIYEKKVISIGKKAFYFCSSLESVTIPDGVTKIGDDAFADCLDLKSITIPNSVTSIGYHAFDACRNLESITIPDSVTSIETGAFRGCRSLKSVTIPSSIINYGDAIFINCEGLESVTLSEGMKTIPRQIFAECYSLKKVTIPNSVARIDNSAFSNCRGLKNITIPDGVRGIGRYAFAGCEKLANLTIPSSVEGIEECAFLDCKSLKSVTFPKTEKYYYIDDNAFGYNYNDGELVKVDGFTIKCYKGTAAETYAKDNGFKIVYIGLKHIAAKAATCTTDGNIEYWKHDGKFYSDEGLTTEITKAKTIVKATGHKWGTPSWTWNGTASASAKFVCSNDKSHVETVKATITSKTTKATCTTDGKTVYTATVPFNGKTYTNTNTVTIPKTGHDWSKWTTTKKATCTADGSKTRTCSVCKKTETATIAKLGHDYKATVVAPTCTAKGYTLHKCSRCGDSYKDTYKDATGHSWSKWTTTKAATCTADGSKTRTCTVCKKTETATIAKLGHDYKATVVAPTCTAKGYTLHKCSRCGDSYKDTYKDATGHSWSKWTTTKAATCTADGSKTRTCTVCKKTETATIAKLGHDYKTTVVAPTCTKQGYTLHKCSRCGDSYKDTYKDATGHNWSKWTTTKAATCTADGVQTRKCTVCGKTESKTIAKTGHKFSAWKTTGFDFAKKTSTQTRKCSACGKTETQTNKNAIERLAGANRYETASIISKKMNPKTSGTVIIATGLTFHDAMVAVPLASAHNAPLLLATEKHITAQTEAELKRLKAKKVIVVSTNGAIGTGAKSELNALGLKTTYIEGKNVFETSTKVAKALQTQNKKTPDTIFFATDSAFADALSASPVAAIKNAPIIYLKNTGSIDKATADYLKSVKGKVKNAYVIGGDGVISNAMMKNVATALGLTVNKTVQRVAGANRYETCVAVNNKFKSVLSSDGICVAKGLDFPDALAGGVYAAATKQALFLADGKKLQDCQNTYLKGKNAAKITVFGGTGAVPDSLVKLIAKASV